jgi:glycosyltransferase involved in cell wall biosynthesis
VAPRKRILIFAYFFPPLGGAGVQRIVKLAKYLPDEGWDPTVVTVRGADYWMTDATLADDLGPRVQVVRTGSLTGLGLLRRLAPRQAGQGAGRRSSVGLIRRLRRLAGWVLLPDSYLGWVPFACRAGERLLREQHFDWILTTSSPDSAHLIGKRLAARHRIPWAADFRDPWTRRLSFAPPTAWHRRRQLALERGVLGAADRLIFTSEATRQDYLRRYPELPGEKAAVITNGFDEEDFAAQEGQAPTGETLRLLHAGQLNPERPARPFLEGLRRFLDRRPEAAARLRVRFVGPAYARDREAAARLGLEPCVAFEPPVGHRRIVAEMLASHLLLLLEQDSERGALILPGKIFEYLRSGRPILGLLPAGGAAWRLIESLGAGRCLRPGDREGIADELERHFERLSRGEAPVAGAPREALAAYERRALTRRWVELFAGPYGPPGRPGAS